MANPQDVQKVKASQHESYGAYTALAILVPGIAWLLGLIFMTKDDKVDRKLGEHVLAISVLFMIIYGVAWLFWVETHASTIAPYYGL